jgi:hypothetical protein
MTSTTLERRIGILLWVFITGLTWRLIPLRGAGQGVES